MTSKVVQEWEQEAKAIAGVMEACVATDWRPSVERNGFEYSNIKPWYNPRWMFEPRDEGVDRVFVGINPGGDPDKPGPDGSKLCDDQRCDHDKLTYYDCDPCYEPYNDWLDAKCWPKRGPTHQKRVRCAIDSIDDVEDVESTMRSTPSFNVCPLRTHRDDGIPDCVWHQSKRWFKRVIKGLQPRTIICNGNGIDANSRSPWRVLMPKLDRCKKIDLGGSQNLKLGIIANEGREPVRVIGLPPLHRYGGSELYSELSNLREHWSDLQRGT